MKASSKKRVVTVRLGFEPRPYPSNPKRVYPKSALRLQKSSRLTGHTRGALYQLNYLTFSVVCFEGLNVILRYNGRARQFLGWLRHKKGGVRLPAYTTGRNFYLCEYYGAFGFNKENILRFWFVMGLKDL